jgi:hypothetical protein
MIFRSSGKTDGFSSGTLKDKQQGRDSNVAPLLFDD